jgi:hypothetical protein
MVHTFPGNSGRPSDDSFIGRLLARSKPHPDSFVCGVRVRDGAVAGERRKWSYRRSAVDRLVSEGVVTLNHGDDVALRLRLSPEAVAPTGLDLRDNWIVFAATETATGAELLITLDSAEIDRIPGLDEL